MKEQNSGLLILFLVLFLFPAAGARAQKSTSELGAQLMEYYETVGTAFWQAENLRDAQTLTPAQRKVLLTTPIPESHPAYPKYFQAATAADSFLKLADENKVQNWMCDPVFYFGGLAHFSLGNYPRAETLFSRLSPDYLRDYYINDRDPVNPEFSTPTKPGISKLLFYCQLKTLSENPEDALAAFKQTTTQAQSTLAAQNEYAHWLANRKSVHDRRQFSESNFGGQPDQLRASALPSTLELLETAWDALLPEAVKKSNLPVRDYLRTLLIPENTLSESTSQSPFDQDLQSTFVLVSAPRPSLSLLASLKLQEIDARIIRSYFSQAQRQLKANNFDSARRYYKRIIKEYPESEASRRAEAALPKVIPIAVAYYKAEGDKFYNPRDKVHVAQPQTKGRDFYRKMYLEDPTGPQADYAYFMWTEAIATVPGDVPKAVRQLHDWLKKFPKSPLRGRALFTMGHFVGGAPIAKYGEAIPWLEKVIEEFPNDKYYVSESLWLIAFFYGWQHKFKEGLPYLERLQREHPQSFRWRHSQSWIDRYREKIASGGRWP